jgi:hypothetical protein
VALPFSARWFKAFLFSASSFQFFTFIAFISLHKQCQYCCCTKLPIPVAARSKALVCGRSLTETVGSNLAGEWMSVFVNIQCCQVEVSTSDWSLLQRSSTECGVCLSVIVKSRQWEGPGPLGAVTNWLTDRPTDWLTDWLTN